MKKDIVSAAIKKREYREFFYDSTCRYPVIPAVKNDEWLEFGVKSDLLRSDFCQFPSL